MLALKVIITKYLDSSQPGWVQCEFKDAYNKNWIIKEKLPVVTSLELDLDSEYPQMAFIACKVIERKIKDTKELLVIDIDHPWGSSGQHLFTVVVKH